MEGDRVAKSKSVLSKEVAQRSDHSRFQVRGGRFQ
jgi:hypothetical protein